MAGKTLAELKAIWVRGLKPRGVYEFSDLIDTFYEKAQSVLPKTHETLNLGAVNLKWNEIHAKVIQASEIYSDGVLLQPVTPVVPQWIKAVGGSYINLTEDTAVPVMFAEPEIFQGGALELQGDKIVVRFINEGYFDLDYFLNVHTSSNDTVLWVYLEYSDNGSDFYYLETTLRIFHVGANTVDGVTGKHRIFMGANTFVRVVAMAESASVTLNIHGLGGVGAIPATTLLVTKVQ